MALGERSRGLPSLSSKIEDAAVWMKVWGTIGQTYPKERIDQLVERTLESMDMVMRGRHCFMEWSGGKDAQVLRYLLDHFKVRDGFCFLSKGLEFPVLDRWYVANLPKGLELIRTPTDLEWLSQNSYMLFPERPAYYDKWITLNYRVPRKAYLTRVKPEMLISGRRKIDGNTKGKQNELGYYTNKEGTIVYAPIYDWTHEDLFAALHWYKIPLAPLYSWPQGWVTGTTTWPMRYVDSVRQGWEWVYEEDPEAVWQASEWFESARLYLEEIGAKR